MLYRLRAITPTPFAAWARGLAYAALPLLVLAILLTRSGTIAAFTGLRLVLASGVLAMLAFAVVAVAAIDIWISGRSGLGSLMRASFIAALVLAYPAYLAVEAIRLPVLNDVSTDIEDAPAFSRSRAALLARGGHIPPTLEPRQRAAQARAYPALKPVMLDMEPDEAYQLVRQVVLALEWRIIEDAAPTGREGQARFDIIAESRLLRFQEDVAIRLREQGGQTRIDIRSASRIGRHDFGANAARIERLIEEITLRAE